uniref:Uncharacterized protein n=1 Tax=Arundo donax TaxID=35708 RepID=A0A0A9B1B7_ARUDO
MQWYSLVVLGSCIAFSCGYCFLLMHTSRFATFCCLCVFLARSCFLGGYAWPIE